MKSKGTTLIELMVAVALMGIVILFTFNILVDIRQEGVNSSVKSEDVMNRILIMRTIQNDFIKKGLYNVSECSNLNSDGYLCINITFKDNSSKQILINKNSVVYDGEKWTLQTGTYDLGRSDYKYCYNYVESGDYYFMTLMFYDNLKGNIMEDNVLLDIELFNTGLTSNTCLPGSRCNRGVLANSTNLCNHYREQV